MWKKRKWIVRLFVWLASKLGYDPRGLKVTIVHSNLKVNKLAGTIEIVKNANMSDLQIREAMIHHMRADLATNLIVERVESENPYYYTYRAYLLIGTEK